MFQIHAGGCLVDILPPLAAGAYELLHDVLLGETESLHPFLESLLFLGAYSRFTQFRCSISRGRLSLSLPYDFAIDNSCHNFCVHYTIWLYLGGIVAQDQEVGQLTCGD